MAGMGLIGHAVAGGMQGFGTAAGGYAKESFLEAERAAAQKLRDERLDEMQRLRDVRTDDMAKAREVAAEERKRAPGIRAARAAEGLISSGVQAVNQGATDEAAALAGGAAPINAQTKLSDKEEARIRARTYAAEGLEDSAFRFSQEARQIDRDEKEVEWRNSDRLERRSEGEANRTAHREIVEMQRKSQERIAGMQASIQREIAKMGTTAVTTNDGSILMMDKQGKPIDYVRDPISGERIVGKKDLPESSLALIRSLGAENKGHEAIIKDPMSSPEQRAAATAQIKENASEMYRLAGVEKPKKESPAAPPAPGTVVDGFEFKGGNPKDKNNWKPAKAASNGAPKQDSLAAAAQPAPSAAPNPMQAQYETEQREMDAGKRTQYSKEVLDWIGPAKKLGSGVTQHGLIGR